jgi:hypothetical protein
MKAAMPAIEEGMRGGRVNPAILIGSEDTHNQHAHNTTRGQSTHTKVCGLTN